VSGLGKVVTGTTPSPATSALWGEGAPFITPSELRVGERTAHVERRLSTTGVDAFASRMVPPRSVCFTCIASIGKMALTTERSLTNQQINTVIVDPARNSPEFVYYLLREAAPRIGAIAGGVATPIINKSAFEAIEVRVPSLVTQRKIAAILSGYDDLIENNERRINLLQDMATRVYTEWFVAFRYPGHEDVPLVASKVGLIPNGWSVDAIEEHGRIVTGSTPSSAEPELWGDGQAFITPTDMSYGRTWVVPARRLSASGSIRLKSRALPVGAVCFTCIASIGKMCMTHESSVTNQQINSLIPNRDRAHPDFVFHKLLAEEPNIRRTASGTATPIISKGVFGAIRLCWPPIRLQNLFGELCGVWHQAVSVLERENECLRAARDLLQPRLMSGEIDVQHLEVLLAGAAG
jgi:type I restriction enzyme S subunit